MLDIVVPVYNEGDNIAVLLKQINEEIPLEKRLILVYDSPDDSTLDPVQHLKSNYNYEIILEKNHYGHGALNAIKSGLEFSNADAVLVTMADLSDTLSSVKNMHQKVLDGYDLVCGSRYMENGWQEGGPLLKGLFSRLAGISLHYLIRIPTHDVTNSFKMYTPKVIDSFSIESNGGFELGMELTIKSYINGFRITEVPAGWTDRVAGESNFKMWEWIPKYLHWYFMGIRYTWFGGSERKRARKKAKRFYRERKSQEDC